MQSAEKILSLKWSSFPSQLAVSMDTCYEKQQFVDVSLVCKDGTILKCHKMVLANASTFFCRLLVANDHPHPMIILHDIDADDLKTIVNFMYCGEIQVVQSEVRRLLRIASILEVTGLVQMQTSETGSPDLENRTFENAKVDQQRSHKNGPEINSGFNKVVPAPRFDSSSTRFDSTGPRFDTGAPRLDSAGPRFDSSGPRFESPGPRFDNNVRFDPNGARFDNSSARFDPNGPRFENNNPRLDPSGRFDINQRFDFNPIRYDSNASNQHRFDSGGFRFDSNTGRFPLNAIRFPRRENMLINQRRMEVFNRSQESRKEFIPGAEAIQTNRLRLAKAGIDIQEGNNKLINHTTTTTDRHQMSRPGTSKSPQAQPFGQKRRDSDPANPLSWTRVLNMLSRDNQLPVKKLCMMDEVEISPSRTLPTPIPSTSQFSPRASSSSMEPVELFIRDDNEFSFDSSAKPNI
ncbi:uncharacterized protein LOC117179150 [Belonocnema kinseyi]|uniref:uncharacterized protein LOC117179150 n=1 Tax=Belonocnema kinseyi TaxID=2817044 RepID=UPI00143D81D6|nr:uncharacterized protein LOC117179150 [Belonocnema kinseyi]